MGRRKQLASEVRAVTKLFRTILIFAAISMSSQVQASPLGERSGGTLQITVTIPPFAAALAAQGTGAVGLWTLDSRSIWLMVSVPREISGDSVEASVFAGASDVVTAQAASDGIEIVSAGKSGPNAFQRSDFIVNRIPKHRLDEGHAGSTGTVVFSTI